MGKRIREKQSGLSSASCSHHTHPGRVWGILHVIKYHHWRHVKRRLTHRKHDGGRHDTRDGTPGTLNDFRVDNMSEHYEPNATLSNVEEKMVQATLPTKHSIKSRLKALIHEEIYKKKGRHKRSSTCPVKSQLTRANSIHHLEVDPLSELLLTAESPEPVLETFQNHLAAGTLDVLSPVFSDKPITSNDKCIDCGAMFSDGTLENSNIHRHQRNLSSPSECVPEEKLMNAKILTRDASPHLFKDFLDALDLINTNKDFLLRYIQDPGSPLPFNIHDGQDFRSKSRRANSISFPVSGSSSGSKDSEPSQLINKMVDDWLNEKEERKLQSHMQDVSMSQSSENSHRVSPEVPNHVKTKHFMDLKKKIKHIIEENKKEKHRIAMDAILDKIPHGNKLSKKSIKFTNDQLKDPTINGEGKESTIRGYGNGLSSYSFNKHQPSTMRTSSLKESASKYSQLYETCFNNEANCPKSESLRLRSEEKSSILKTPKSFKRFLSLPNLKSYFHQSEDPSVFLSSQNSSRQYNDDSTSSTTVTDQQRSFDHIYDSKTEVLPPDLGDNAIQESILNADQNQLLVRSASKSRSNVNDEARADKSVIIEGLRNLTDSDGTSCYEEVSGHRIESTPILGEANSVFSSDTSFLDETFDLEKLNILEEDFTNADDYVEAGSDFQLGPADGLDNMAEQQDAILDHPEVVESGDNFQKLETLSRHFNYEIACIEVDPSHEAAFNYVRKVLELSGFTGFESLGLWYSDDQPVNPLVFEELEGCLLLDPDCSGNSDEGGQCNHLLLFDIVNEGLLEIFGRSYSYYPKPLSSLSHVHPLPVGENVLQKIWALISWYLNSTSEVYPSLDYYVSRDLAKNDGWMNLQFDSECVALELDDLIFYDLLEEIIYV